MATTLNKSPEEKLSVSNKEIQEEISTTHYEVFTVSSDLETMTKIVTHLADNDDIFNDGGLMFLVRFLEQNSRKLKDAADKLEELEYKLI